MIGETNNETRPIFKQKASEVNAPIYFAEDEAWIQDSSFTPTGKRIYQTKVFAGLEGELGGLCQEKNTATLLSALHVLQELGYSIAENYIRHGFSYVCQLTGLMGRWQKLEEHPTLICDTGHNKGGIEYIVNQLLREEFRQLHIVIGMVNDKDISGVLTMLPKDAVYYFTQASVQRALPAIDLKRLAQKVGLQGNSYMNVEEAVQAAKNAASKDDFIFVGGSTFIVADLLNFFFKKIGK